ncbi:MAG: cytochrome c, 15 heme-binding site [Holophagaceae bacterium]|nr:cytochrome c, 15 heme-binding site [Holophagaceae bacterium]
MQMSHRAEGHTGQVFRACLAVLMGLLLWACSGGSGGPSVNQTGEHPTGWLNSHWSAYAKNPDQCSSCHGSLTDSAAAGGITKVSCFTCHPNGPGHPEGWASGLQHGRTGAEGVAGEWTGQASCTKCHGSDYAGGIVAVSCTQCHTAAPHPEAPWLSSTPNSHASHNATDVSNAPECWRCHADGARLTTPTAPAPAGIVPGCYNSTMCHGTP